MNLKKGIKLIEETEGTGKHVQRQKYYLLAIRLTLNITGNSFNFK